MRQVNTANADKLQVFDYLSLLQKFCALLSIEEICQREMYQKYTIYEHELVFDQHSDYCTSMSMYLVFVAVFFKFCLINTSIVPHAKRQ